jgi:predicted permease
MIKNHLKIAWRTLMKNRSVSWINIIGLSAGMTAAVLIFLWVQNEMTYDGYHPDAARIYRLTAHLTKANWTWETSPLPLAVGMSREVPELETVASIQPFNNINFRLGNELFIEKQTAYVDSGWFKMFHYDFIEGNPTSLFSHPFSVLLTQTKAKKYFGDKNPIGRTIRIDTINYRIAAVVRDIPANSSFRFDMLMPLDALLADPKTRKNEESWNNFNYLTFLKLRPAASPAKVAAAANRILTAGKKEVTTDISLTPLRDIHFEIDLTSGGMIEHANKKTVYIFSVLGIFLLVIACINYVNITTAMASVRAKEVGIRKIVGAGKKSLFLQFMLESILFSAISLSITVLLVWQLMPLFRELTDKNFPTPLASSATWQILGITLLTATLLNGIYPALVLSSFRPLNVLKGSTILNFKDVYLRKGLFVLQFTFSIVLIAGTLIIQRQLSYIQHLDAGYDRSQVFCFRLPFALYSGKEDKEVHSLVAGVKQQLTCQTGITGVTVASQSLVDLHSSNSGSADWDGHDKNFVPTVFQLSADEDYLKVLHLQMQQGRWYDPMNATDQKNFILNETAVNELNIRKPVLGQRFTFQGDTGKIIGVVKDFHFASLHQKIKPLVILNNERWRAAFFIRTDPGKTTTALTAARKIWESYAPDKPFDFTFLDEQFDSLYKADSKISSLILLFSVIAIIISCFGLFGLAAFTARQRVKEIGIRKVLGATVTDIMNLLSRDFIRLVLLSVLIATPIAWWAMSKWLQDFAYHIPLNAWVFALAGGLDILIALLTVSTQSLGAARANPVKNLRIE